METNSENNQPNESETMPEEPPIVKKKRFPWLLVILIGLVIVIGAGVAIYVITTNNAKEYALNGPCGTARIATASKQINDLLVRWEDASQIAGSTSRIALSGPIADMQSIKREFDALETPGCMKNIQTNFSDGMQYAIQAHIAFMGQDSDARISSLFSSAVQSFKWGQEALIKLAACAPNCEE